MLAGEAVMAVVEEVTALVAVVTVTVAMDFNVYSENLIFNAYLKKDTL